MDGWLAVDEWTDKWVGGCMNEWVNALVKLLDNQLFLPLYPHYAVMSRL